MPIYYKYDIEDLKELVENGCVSQQRINNFIDDHHYYTCSCCGKEELYVESPVLKDNVWDEVLNKLAIKDNKETPYLVASKIPNEKEFQEAVRFFKLFKQINKVVTNDKYVMLCRDCVENGLGRELYQEDLADCIMTENIKYKFKNRK